MQVAWIRSLVGELGSHRPCGMAKKLKKTKKQAFQIHNLCWNYGPEDSAPSTRHQSLPPGSLHKPLDQINPPGGRHQKQEELWPCSLRKGDHRHRKILGEEKQSPAYLIQWPERGPIFRNHPRALEKKASSMGMICIWSREHTCTHRRTDLCFNCCKALLGAQTVADCAVV